MISSVYNFVCAAVTVVNLRVRKEHVAKTGGRNVRSLPNALVTKFTPFAPSLYKVCRTS